MVNASSDSNQEQFVHQFQRAFQVCSAQEAIDTEITNTKQVLINNFFTNRVIDKEIARMRTNDDSDINVVNNLKIFYKNQMSNSYCS